MEITRKTLPEQHYLYADREVDLQNPAAIGAAMGSAFAEVFAFAASNGITPLSMPISLYVDMPEGTTMRFRGGVFVSANDAAKHGGAVQAGTIPAGDVLTTTHVGPYASLNVSHRAVWDRMSELDLPKAMPVWEVYVDDPTQVSESDCRTEIFRAIG